jgi:glycosyltransferase involved in cell wall biosynthesis
MSELISTVEIERPRESTAERPHPLRIAQVAPLYESVPPKLYGGTERVVSYLTEELVRRGNQVTLFASGDSVTSAKLQAGYPKALRLAGLAQLAANGMGVHLPMLSQVFDHAGDFDIIHCHIDYWTFPFSRLVATPSITTLHGRLDLDELHPIYHNYKDLPLISISDAQRKPLASMNWVATIHHGVPREHLRFNPNRGKYLAFLGRIAPEKRPDIAIQVARKAGIPLKIAAKVDEVDREYFKTTIEPMINAAPDVEYIGEINELQKSEFLGNALALLFTIDWPEPFGLVMIEALACGTPVIARPCGSVPEVVRDGVTGFIASEFDELVAAVKKIDTLSRQACREEYERRFAVEVMAEKYERVYRELIANWNQR